MREQKEAKVKIKRSIKLIFRIGLFVFVTRRLKKWTWFRPKPTVATRLVIVVRIFLFDFHNSHIFNKLEIHTILVTYYFAYYPKLLLTPT